MACKIVFFYEQYQQGWTEVYYKTVDEPRAAAESFTNAQLNRFVAPRDKNVVLTAIRASLIGAPRNAFLRIVNKSRLVPPLDTETPDVTATCGLVRLLTTGRGIRHIWLRGLPDIDVQRNPITGKPYVGAEWQAAFDQYAGLFPNIGLALRLLDPISVNPWRAVFSFGPDTLSAAQTRVTPFPGVPLPAANTTVYFRGLDQTQVPGLKGYFQVLRSDAVANLFTIGYRWKNSAVAYFPLAASYRLATYTYPQIDEAQFQNFRTRDTGRPTAGSRGRRVAMKLRS